MDSEALRTFLAVYRQGGVSAAADVLARTQSAISRRLQLLEQQVGTPLFERIGRSLVLNEVGQALLPYAERVVATLDDARAAVEAAQSGDGGVLRVVAVGTLAGARLSRALLKLKASFAKLDVRLQTATSAEVSAQVRAGEASIGLRYFEDRSRDLDCRVLYHEQLVVACAPKHPLAGKRVRSLAQLAGERWLAFPMNDQRRENFATTVFAQFTTRGVDAIDWVAIDSLTAQKRLVEAGFGLALLQMEAIAEERSARQLDMIHVQDLDVRIPVVRVLRKGGFIGGGAKALLGVLEGSAFSVRSRRR